MRTRILPVLAAAALCLTVGFPITAPAVGGVQLSTDAASWWRVEGAGSLVRIARADGRVERVPAGVLPPLTAVAAGGDRLYGLSPSPDGRNTTLLAIAPGSFEIVRRWELRGTAELVRATPGGEVVCVAAKRGPGAGTIHFVTPGAAALPVSLAVSFEPEAIALTPDPAAQLAQRLVVAGSDRLATWTLQPPSPSWFYRSPGHHHAVAFLPGGSPGALAALRDRSLIAIDPARRERVEGRAKLSDDDATAIVPLPSAGRDLAVLPAGDFAATMLEDGRTIAWVDLQSGRVAQSKGLDAPHELALSPEGAVLVPLEGNADAALIQMLEPPERTPAESASAPPVAPAVPATAAATPWESPVASEPPQAAPPQKEPPAPGPPPPSPDPVPSPGPSGPEPSPEPPPDASPDDDEGAPAESPPGKPVGPPAQAEPSAAPQVKPAPSASEPEPKPPVPAGLSGRLTGSFGVAKEVRIYGPNNILKLHARAPIAQDGTWSVPLPPPGTYRVLVAPEPGANIFTRPEFQSVSVDASGAAHGGLDFEVRGAL